MHTLALLAGAALILITLVDAFEGVLLPRRVNHPFRYSRLYYRTGWSIWRGTAMTVMRGRAREGMLGAFGPLSLLGLFASWIFCLILGFALVQWALGALVSTSNQLVPERGFINYLYFSGTTYFTLGIGDVIPLAKWARALTVLEGGLGFGFLAIIISYLPVLYQAFSRREIAISLLDARAGSPPTAGEFVRRIRIEGKLRLDDEILRQWEQWCAELLESVVSFPVLGYYRSQHANQSWVAALTMMLDSCAALIVQLPMDQSHQAQLTFAMARHAAVDLALIVGARPIAPDSDRFKNIPAEGIAQVFGTPCESGDSERDCLQRFTELRETYESFMQAIANHFVLQLPPIVGAEHVADNWQRSKWMPRTPGIGSLPAGKSEGEHFG